MSETPRLSLPEIATGQAQKHVTHNDALARLDVLVQVAIAARDLTAPPAQPAEGELHIVAAGATDGWAGQDGQIASWRDGSWTFHAPFAGLSVYVVSEAANIQFDGSGWVGLSGGVGETVARFGINAIPDDTNRLSVTSPAALFSAIGTASGGTGDMRVIVNKEATGQTASHLFQTGFSGRAEFGLTGDDDFHVKVSPDGTNWLDAITIDRMTGMVQFPAGLPGLAGGTAGREMLTADRVYYVSPTGSDSNDGLSSVAPFATIQKAIDAANSELDFAGYTVTVQLADGTYNEAVTVKPMIGMAGTNSLVIQGNATAPSNVVINATGTGFYLGGKSVAAYIKDMEITATSVCVAADGSSVNLGNIVFGSAVIHVQSTNYAFVSFVSDYSIAGSAATHLNATVAGIINCISMTVTINGTPAFSSAFVAAFANCYVRVSGNTYSGSATGTRYSISANSVVFTSGAPSTYLPGDAAGATNTGGQYL